MIDSLKCIFVSNQVQKHLMMARINPQLGMIKLEHLQNLINLVKDDKKIKLVLETIREIITSADSVQKLKGMMVVHYLFKRTKQPLLLELVEQNQLGDQNTVNQRSSDSKVFSYIDMHITTLYKSYLQNIISKGQTFFLIQEFQSKNVVNKIEAISHGFEVINLVYMVLKTQQSFNKMGRYYIEHQQILSLYLMYLEDLCLYNEFLKKVTRMCISLPNLNTAEQIKHNFLFINQAQIIADKLSQFFYNRYFYPQVKKIFQIPAFMNITNECFDKVKRQVRKVDQQLIICVRKSSYNWDQKSSLTTSIGNSKKFQKKKLFDYTLSTERSSDALFKIDRSYNCNPKMQFVQEVQEEMYRTQLNQLSTTHP